MDNNFSTQVKEIISFSREEALRFFNLETNKVTVLSVGGSLGAKSINDALANKLDSFAMHNLQLIWQTGKTTAGQYQERAKGLTNIWVGDFITQMELGYAAADIVISRSGAMAVTEMCIAGKPVIFVPYPHAAEDHQTANAKVLVNEMAALIVKDKEANEKLVGITISLAENLNLQKKLHSNISRFAIKDADVVIAKEILNQI